MSRCLVGEHGYQFGWSKDHPRTLDQEFRTRKARKILAVLKEALESRDPSSMRALDVGASAGISWAALAGLWGGRREAHSIQRRSPYRPRRSAQTRPTSGGGSSGSVPHFSRRPKVLPACCASGSERSGRGLTCEA